MRGNYLRKGDFAHVVGFALAFAITFFFWFIAVSHLLGLFDWIPTPNPVFLLVWVTTVAMFTFDWKEFEIVKWWGLVGVFFGESMIVISGQLSLGDYIKSLLPEFFLALLIAAVIRAVKRCYRQPS